MICLSKALIVYLHIPRGSQWEEEAVATTGQKGKETIGEKTRSPWGRHLTAPIPSGFQLKR